MTILLNRKGDRKGFSHGHGSSLLLRPKNENDGLVLKDEITVERVASIMAERSMNKHKHLLKGLSIEVKEPDQE